MSLSRNKEQKLIKQSGIEDISHLASFKGPVLTARAIIQFQPIHLKNKQRRGVYGAYFPIYINLISSEIFKAHLYPETAFSPLVVTGTTALC